MKTANYWIEKLELKDHPEGGYYKETYRSDEEIGDIALPKRYSKSRNVSTSIYYLLAKTDISKFHRLKTDETWHFYQGNALELFVIDAKGGLIRHLLGANYDEGEKLQITIERNQWFGARVRDAVGYALVGCTMAPGFHFDDFELAKRSNLIDQFPNHKDIISELTGKKT